jgi:hypothetical protein
MIEWQDDGRHRRGGYWVVIGVIGVIGEVAAPAWPIRWRGFDVLGMRVWVNEDEALRRMPAWGPVRACAQVIEEALEIRLWSTRDLGERQIGAARHWWMGGYVTIWDVLHAVGESAAVAEAARAAVAYEGTNAQYVVPADLVWALPPRARCAGCGRGLPRVQTAAYPTAVLTRQPEAPGRTSIILTPEPWCPTCRQRQAGAARQREELRAEWRAAARVLRQARRGIREARQSSHARTGGSGA